MLKIAFLRNILIIALLLVTVLPLYQVLVLQPAYHRLQVQEIEDEAVRQVAFLVRSLDLEGRRLDRSRINSDVLRMIGLAMEDRRLLKLRVFSPTGEIVYSSRPDEIGRINRRLYFIQQVARGQTYSKVVRSNQRSADGQIIRQDVVETYVPVMTADGFGGAIEVYFDVTESWQRLRKLTLHSQVVLTGLAIGLLVIILMLLGRASRFLRDRQQAEEELKQSHHELEARVQERTGQLLLANQQLAEEVAERSRAQAALRQALDEAEAERDKIDGILESVADGLLVVDGRRRLVHFNRPAEEIFSLSSGSALGMKLEEVLPDTRLLSPLLECLNSISGTGQFDFVRPDPGRSGHQLTYQARCAPLRSRQGDTSGHIILVQDVSRERELERMKSEFLAMAAHELHTPITTIMGYSELLGSRPLDEFSEAQRKEFIGYICSKAEALARMVDDLLDIARREAGYQLDLRLEDVDVVRLVRAFVAAHPTDKEHSYRLQLPEAPLEWRLDRVRFEQLLGNLISNAIKYSPNGGEISIALAIRGQELELVVEDRGIGMDEEVRRRIFERFYRADTSTTAVSGAGLGMSVALMVVEAHGGRIDVESEKEKGTRVVVHLPASAGD
ncbi:MAG: hypothetical protein Tsb0017_05490 [Geothermobacteraceae bacterium]